jgi:hypothetical protein
MELYMIVRPKGADGLGRGGCPVCTIIDIELLGRYSNP